MNTHTKTEELVEAVFSMRSRPSLLNEQKFGHGSRWSPSITCYMCEMLLDERPSIFIRDKPIFSSERMLHKDYYSKGSVQKRISGHESHGA
jgi:hypothetical protein